MSAITRKLAKDWQLVPLAACIVGSAALVAFKGYDKIFNDVNINLSTKTADVGDWELRAALNDEKAKNKIRNQSIFSQR